MKTAFSSIVGASRRTIARITYLGVGLCLGHSLAVIKSARTTPSGEIASPTKTSTVDSISTPKPWTMLDKIGIFRAVRQYYIRMHGHWLVGFPWEPGSVEQPPNNNTLWVDGIDLWQPLLSGAITSR